MANELTLAASLKFVKGATNVSFAKSGIQVDVSGTGFAFKSQNVGTSEEALDIGDVTTPGYILIYNNDSTNYVEVRGGSGETDVVKVRAGKLALFELATTTPYVIADTASVEIIYAIVDA